METSRAQREDVIADAVRRRWFGRAIAAMRIFFGIVFVHNGIAKLLPAVPNLWPDTPIGFVINAEGNRSARSILEFEVIRGALELAVGVMLVIGLLTPVAALIAAGMVLHLQFATLWNDKWIYEYSVEWVPLLCLAALRAGRWHGLDARFAITRARWPG